MSAGRASGAIATSTVRARSAAEIPVVTPVAASIDSVKLVPCDERFADDHQRQVELPAPLLGQREADEAAGVAGHEVDRLGRDEVGGKHEVALVLAVLLVDEDDHAAGLEVGDDVGDRGERHRASG